MDKQTKRELKKQRKQIFVFLGACLPVMLIIVFLLYKFVPSLMQSQWVVIALVVIIGLVGWFGVQAILKKQEEKQAAKPKKKDPFSD